MDMSCTNIKWKLCLLNCYSGCLGDLLALSEKGVVHYNWLWGAIILASAVICESIIDVTSQNVTRLCQKWYKQNMGASPCIKIKIYGKPCGSYRRIWLKEHYRLTTKQLNCNNLLYTVLECI